MSETAAMASTATAPAPAGQRAPTTDDVAPALRTVFRIFGELGIRVDDGRILLGGIARETYYRWRRDPRNAPANRDLLERLSYLLGIYKAMRILIPDAAQRTAFLHRPNASPVCGGRSPLEVMRGGQVADLYRIRRWLDGERSGW